ncbi:MAG TPA: HEAT repeat domain-containing protein, partial [Candidatus Hydrogenedentes bacterium]|nr:HEAT repeat domain-containing protein [Candidatus Hydrogenedentota bacterium]
HVDSAREMFRAIHHAPEPKAQFMAAAQGWITADPRSAARLLMIMLTEADFEIVLQAMHHVRAIPGTPATRFFVELLETESLPPENEALLIKALVDRGDRFALPAVTKALASEHEAVRAAALEGLGVFGDASSVPALARVAAESKGEEQRMARSSLYRLPGEAVDAAILDELSRAEAAVRVELIRAVAERATPGALDLLVARVGDDDAAVREAAVKALAGTAAFADLPRMTDLLLECPDELRSAMTRTVVQVARKAGAPEDAAAPVVAALDKAEAPSLKAAILLALGEIGDPATLDTLRAAVKHSNEDIAYAAVSALSSWPDAAPLADLIDIARNSDVDRFRSKALDGYVRMLRLPSDRPAAETAALYEQALQLASNASAKRRILSGLSDLADPKALEIVERYLDDEAVRTEAAVAAERIRANFYELSASSNLEMLRQALDKNVDTRWTSGTQQAGGEWFVIDMTHPAEIAGIVLDTSRSSKDYPRAYEVYAYTDEAAPGDPVAQGDGSGPVLEVKFPPVTARYLKIVQTGRADDGFWWSIDELRVLVK